MADDDELDSHKHRRKNAGKAEWSETCIGLWSKTYKETSSKDDNEQRRCRGISILHLNKFASSSKVKNIPTTGIEIVIRESENVSTTHNLHPFLGIFVDEKNVEKKINDTESNQERKVDSDKLKDQTEEATPKILEQVVENWGNRIHNVGNKLTKYYHEPSSSAEILAGVKNTISSGYETTVRILSYCQPREKAKQISNFISEHLKNVSKWWKEP